MHALDAVRAYYAALDDGDYDRLTDLLAPDFVQRRPDRRLAGRDRFVRFMREERPRTDTRHAVDGLYRPAATADPADAPTEVVARGRLLAAGDAGDALVGFVDVFAVDGATLTTLDTYTN